MSASLAEMRAGNGSGTSSEWPAGRPVRPEKYLDHLRLESERAQPQVHTDDRYLQRKEESWSSKDSAAQLHGLYLTRVTRTSFLCNIQSQILEGSYSERRHVPAVTYYRESRRNIKEQI
jgi:hypothetical protein